LSEIEDLARGLHPDERIVMELISKGAADIEQIARDVTIPLSGATWAAYSLKDKGLVSVDEKVDVRYSLGTEGEKYLQLGFPEMRFISKIKGEISIDQMDLLDDERKFGIPWSLRRGWISVKSVRGERIVSLTDSGKYALRVGHPEVKLLERVKSGLSLSSADLDLLEKLKTRGDVIRERKRKSTLISLTDLGLKVLKESKGWATSVNVLSTDIIVSGKWKSVNVRPYNISVPTKVIYPGRLHPYQQIIDEVRSALVALGFEEIYSPPVEINFWNCDVLFMPSDHPARDIHDMFYLKKPRFGTISDKELLERVKETHENGWLTGSLGWGSWDPRLSLRCVLRSQTTSVSARYLSKVGPEQIPCKMFTIDRNYRPEKADSIHLPEFNQCEGIVAAPGVNLRHLMGYMRRIAEVFGVTETRFQPGYFPFTEPTVVGFLKHPKLGWVEAMPGGIFRPEVTLPLGIEVPVLAWGLGIDRLAMLALDIEDIRQLFSTELDWLRNIPFPTLRT